MVAATTIAAKLKLLPNTWVVVEPWQIVTTIFLIIMVWIYNKVKPLPIPSSLPGPKRYPFFGYLWHPIKYWHIWPDETTRCMERYDMRTWGGPLPNFGGLPGGYFYIHDENNIRHILQTNFDNYGKGTMWIKVLGELLGEGIFAVDGEKWKTHRKLMSNMFSRNLLRHTAVVTKEKLFQVLDVFERRRAINAAAAADGEEDEGFDVDIQDIFFRLTIDVTSIVTFDVDIDSVGNERQHKFARAFDELSNLCQKRFLDPLFEIKRLFQLTWRERRIVQLEAIVDEFAYGVIASKRRSAEEGSPHGPDLLSRYIDHARKANEDISDSELRDVVMNVMLAGRDTTACALSWTFYELTRHPEVVTKVIQEVESVCGVGGQDEAEFTFDTMSKLKYTHAVALEVLRLHPPVTNDPRYAVSADFLPDGTKIPAGAGLDLCFYSMGRKKNIWGGDALEFKPERFFEKKEPSPFKYPVFNSGPRMCLGRPLALMNMKLAMSILLTSKFEFTDKLGHSGEYLWTLVEAMAGGFEVNVTSTQTHTPRA